MDYWKVCIEEAFDEAGIKATDDQIEIVAGCVEGGHENYGMAHGSDAIPNPLEVENDRLRAELQKEREKVFCKTCNGKGRIVTLGPHHSGDSECYKCRGEGRHSL